MHLQMARLVRRPVQEIKKKEMEDLEAMLAEFGVAPAAAGKDEGEAGGDKKKKKEKKKKAEGANGEGEAAEQQAGASQQQQAEEEQQDDTESLDPEEVRGRLHLAWVYTLAPSSSWWEACRSGSCTLACLVACLHT